MTAILNDTAIRDLRRFGAEGVSEDVPEYIRLLAKKVRRDILTMTVNAGSGHIGGSMSSADIYLMLWLCANITPANIYDEDRDRIVVSHGHTSPGLYSVLGNLGFFDISEAVSKFRKKDSLFEGHPNSRIPGVEWGSGSLGQGLSIGCGFAMAARIKQHGGRVFVVMGDGEQQKGQITEACEFAAKYQLSNLTAIVDLNGLQASGSTSGIMPADIFKKYETAGWDVIAIDGHDFNEIYQALKYQSPQGRPVAVIANTVMGKGFSSIENNFEYHGRILSRSQYDEALTELGEAALQILPLSPSEKKEAPVEHSVDTGTPILYAAGKPVECRTAAGEAIYDIIRTNTGLPIVVLDCDLMESVKTMKVQKEFPQQFIECGIQEHNAASVTGALSKAGVMPFFLDFGVFGLDETYGQHRMNDVNDTSLKLIITHCGLDVGEDGKTHQCVDYVSLTNNLRGYRIIVPADANQTDRVIRYIASTPGNFVVAVGRSKMPVLTNEKGEPFYAAGHAFVYGQAEWIREGKNATIITAGNMVHRAVKASEELAAENIHAGVLNISCPAAIDIREIAKACSTGVVVTYEDHFVSSGMGSMIGSLIAEHGFSCRFKRMGVTKYGKSCSAEEQYPLQELDSDSLKKTIQALSVKS